MERGFHSVFCSRLGLESAGLAARPQHRVLLLLSRDPVPANKNGPPRTYCLRTERTAYPTRHSVHHRGPRIAHASRLRPRSRRAACWGRRFWCRHGCSEDFLEQGVLLSYQGALCIDRDRQYLIPNGNPPIFSCCQKWSYAAMASFCMGVMPPSAIFGRSWLYVHSQWVALCCTCSIESNRVRASQA